MKKTKLMTVYWVEGWGEDDTSIEVQKEKVMEEIPSDSLAWATSTALCIMAEIYADGVALNKSSEVFYATLNRIAARGEE